MSTSLRGTDILRNALEVICSQVDANLSNIDERTGSWVVLGNIVDHGGAINPGARDKVVMAVYGLTREGVTRGLTAATPAPTAVSGNAFPVTPPPLFLDVHLMFLANFVEGSYADGLAALSRVIAFFQQTPVITRNLAPALDPALDRVTLDFEDLPPTEINYVMSMFGTRYLPSAFYKMRMLPFVSGAMQARGYPVTGPSGGVSAA